MSQPPALVPDPLCSQKVHQIDQKGNLSQIRFSLDAAHFNLKFEKLYYSLPSTPFSPAPFSQGSLPPTSPLSPRPPPTPNRHSIKRLFSFASSRSSSRTSSSGYSSISAHSVVSAENIPLEEIHEIRVSDYDSKLNLINTQALKELKLLVGGNRKNHMNKDKILEILYGREFNLKHLKFLVTSLVEFGGQTKLEHLQQQQQPKNANVLDQWVVQLESLMRRVKSLGYFEKLDMWYKKQFDVTIDKCTSNHRLKIWKQFLHRIQHQISTESLRIEYDYLHHLLTQYNSNFCTGPLGNLEFEVAARYFVHSSNTASKIFDVYLPGAPDNSGLLELLETATYKELVEHPVLGPFQEIFNNFFTHMQTHGQNLPEISAEMDGASVFTRAVIRRFAQRFQEHNKGQLVQEKWQCSYYILDYLYSSENTIWDVSTTEIHQPMTQPLSHYFIASSHNTYLTGDQYASPSSVEPYARCLRQGCRCIEIDIWNGPKNKPIVKHGRTLTTEVKLKDVLITIRKHAFESTPYPLIISIENHCNLKQQRVVAKYFRGIFGKMLVTTPMDFSFEDACNLNQLPSPEQLKNRVILKGRTLPTSAFACNENDDKPTDEFDEKRLSFCVSSEFPTQRSSFGHFGSGNSLYHGSSSSSLPEANPCDCLITGELHKKNDNGHWIPCIFVLTNKKLFYIEKRDENDEIGKGKLPNYLRNRHLMLRPSVASWESNQDLHNDQLWFHGKMAGGRQAATVLLEQCKINGSFLVRDSDTTTNGYTLCFYYKDPGSPETDHTSGVNHCHIFSDTTKDDERMYFLRQNASEGEKFPSIFELIEHYKNNPLNTSRCRLDHLVTPVPHSSSHELCEWFYKDMDRKGSEMVLEKLPINGAFLGRYRTGIPGEIVISFRIRNVIKHCHIKMEGRYLTVSNLKFVKLENLVDHYSRNAFYKDIKLEHPVGKELYTQSQQSDCVLRVYACPEYLNSTVKTVKGRVRAIQSYTSSDPEYLSFKKGDIIVNVIKEPDGWWAGTREDATVEEAQVPKQFFSSFVEDVEELDGPFDDFTGKGNTFDLGIGAKVKLCTDKNGKQNGINYYISFKDLNGTKRTLGACCSKRKVNEWVEMINFVVATDEESRKERLKKLAAEKYNIAAEFSDLMWLQAMEKFCPEKVEEDKENINGNLIKSFDEMSGDRLFRSKAPLFVLYHQYGLTRVYPKGFRLDSSNYNPVKFWNFGCQMPSLNYQTPDKAMQWNRGMFRRNGNCGYVLKPDFMLPDKCADTHFDPTCLNTNEFSREKSLTIQIISARHLERTGSGQITPIVEVEVLGIDADCTKMRTSTQDTGLNPCWNETFNLKIQCPDLALVQFSVCDLDYFGDRVLLGECTIPFPCMRQGYRSIQLNSAYGYPLFSVLLVHIQMFEQNPVSPLPTL